MTLVKTQKKASTHKGKDWHYAIHDIIADGGHAGAGRHREVSHEGHQQQQTLVRNVQLQWRDLCFKLLSAQSTEGKVIETQLLMKIFFSFFSFFFKIEWGGTTSKQSIQKSSFQNVCLLAWTAFTYTKLPLVGWLKFFELNWIPHEQEPLM